MFFIKHLFNKLFNLIRKNFTLTIRPKKKKNSKNKKTLSYIKILQYKRFQFIQKAIAFAWILKINNIITKQNIKI